MLQLAQVKWTAGLEDRADDSQEWWTGLRTDAVTNAKIRYIGGYIAPGGMLPGWHFCFPSPTVTPKRSEGELVNPWQDRPARTFFRLKESRIKCSPGRGNSDRRDG
jgi:hypothetical protein